MPVVERDAPGLSPPVRGSRTGRLVLPGLRGSIPARAGEPGRRRSGHAPRVVYPRPCGGARGWTCGSLPISGLSPPVRGSPSCEGAKARGSRSIPARAGEPWASRAAIPRCRVYPRPCGGAAYRRYKQHNRNGLSPPVRGSHKWEIWEWVSPRSIPARAGEPRSAAPARGCRRSIPARAGEPSS